MQRRGFILRSLAGLAAALIGIPPSIAPLPDPEPTARLQYSPDGMIWIDMRHQNDLTVALSGNVYIQAVMTTTNNNNARLFTVASSKGGEHGRLHP